MYMHDYHTDKPEVILLLHPMLAAAEMMHQLLGSHFSEYRLLIPDLAGHGEAVGQPFQSAEREAAEIAAYLREIGVSQVRLGYGASLGAIVLMELMRQPGVRFGHLFFEGASFHENANFVGKTVGKVFLAKHKRAVENPARSVEMMGQLYGKQAAEPMAKSFIAMTDESILNIAHVCTHVRLPEADPEQQKRMSFSYGDKDEMLKEAKKLQKRRYPAAELVLWKGYGHCQRITADPDSYAEYLKKYL